MRFKTTLTALFAVAIAASQTATNFAVTFLNDLDSLAVNPAPAFTKANITDVFLCTGQSNAEGASDLVSGDPGIDMIDADLDRFHERVFVWDNTSAWSNANLDQTPFRSGSNNFCFQALKTLADNNPGKTYGLVLSAQSGQPSKYWINNINWLVRSEGFDSGIWTKSNTTITANSTTSPDGLDMGDTIASDGVGTSDEIYQGLTLDASTQYTASVYLKAGTGAQYLFGVRKDATDNPFTFITNTAGTLTLGFDNGLDSSSITAVTDAPGWYRVVITFTTVAAGSYFFKLQPNRGNDNGSVIAWGAQFEPGDTANTYAPTASTACTSKPCGLLYAPSQTRVTAALADIGLTQLAGIFWHQGEADSYAESANTHIDRVNEIIADYRAESFASATTPFIAGEIIPAGGIYDPTINAGLNTLNTDGDDYTATVDIDAWFNSSYGDNVHFNSPGLRKLGLEYAKLK